MPAVPHHFLILACETEEHQISDVGQMIKAAMDFKGDLTQDASKEDGIFKKTARGECGVGCRCSRPSSGCRWQGLSIHFS